jgi:catecholate siderophore receptor
MRRLALSLLVIASVAPATLRAQESIPPRPDSSRSQPVPVDSSVTPTAGSTRADSSAKTLERVVVTGRSRRTAYTALRSSTATRTDIPLRDTPQSVSIVTRSLIADQAMQSMADVARYVPGVSMAQGEGHRDAPVIRGNSSTADFFVDGVRDDVQYLRDLYNAERIEVLKGPNAMIFGRGGGGGVINRVTKEAAWLPVRTLTMEGGSFDHRRAMLDAGQGVSGAFAGRINGMYEHSGFFRDATALERFGINPTATIVAGNGSVVRLGYEFLDDRRTVDRGIPSFQGRPSAAPATTFFGDPAASHARARVHAAAVIAEHVAPSGLTVRNKTRFASYDKYYQNVLPGAVNVAGDTVSLSAYNNATQRANLFNQTDVVYSASAGAVRQTLLVGAELGRQSTDNFRNTGYFSGSATSFNVPFDAPTVTAPVTFRQSATDADNQVVATVAALYAQNQVELTSYWQAIAGIRYDRFDVRYHNNRDGQRLRRTDRMLSPRAGLVFKPADPVSFYGSYGVSYLPASGDQFSSLTTTTSTLEPERFRNLEVGAKWDVRPDLALTVSVYRLDRTNTSARDPNDPTRTVQTGSQRTSGYELSLSGDVTSAWQVALGFALQRALIRSATAAAAAGSTVPMVPGQTVSLWNRYQLLPALGIGAGVIHQAKVYAAIDDAVTLPAFTRADAALFYTLNRFVRAQANVENVFDRRYFATAQGNNNIMPGATRTLRLSLTTGF